MRYPIQYKELQEFYTSYAGEEPKEEIKALLDSVTDVVNHAYIEGVKTGINESKI